MYLQNDSIESFISKVIGMNLNILMYFALRDQTEGCNK